MKQRKDVSGGVNPFTDGGWFGPWHGRVLTPDGADPIGVPIPIELVDRVIADYNSGGEYDGDVAGVVRLVDGRFVAWVTFYGPTGHGFLRDAYGGGADVTVTTTLDAAVRWGLTDEARRWLGIGQPGEGKR